ncbi:MAG: M48 family metalloprotease, partial [Geopsychrobacter sp.]|nr:M48 family metalloprotease [Geopsychrobacter sp.]
ACATHPVTGKNELMLIPESMELEMGQKNYLPARQMQGGDYVADPAVTAYVREVGQKMAAVSDRKLPYEFVIVNDSEINAWMLPGGKMGINRGLLMKMDNEAELAAVLSHEIVHAAARHGARSMSKGMLIQAGVIGTALATQGTDYATLAQQGAGLGAQLITQRYGRDAERESDHYGMLYMVRAGYNPQGAVDLQRTFVKLSEGRDQGWLKGLFASHPPSYERVQNNLELLATLPKGGESGVASYRAKIAHLLKTKPAYTAYDKGRKALAQGQVATARRLAQRAIDLEPKEDHFYGLMGDIEQKDQHLDAALQQYDQATRLNPGFFYYYLQRGKVNEKLNLPRQAQDDLKRNIKLLATADAYNTLGDLARKTGRIEEAKRYYAKVAGSRGEMGKQAYTSLVDLDLPDNPAKYIRVKTGQDKQGRIVAQLSNPTPRNIDGIVLLIQYQDVTGRAMRVKRGVTGTVKAGSQQMVDLSLSGKLSREQIKRLQVKIIAAQVQLP